MKSYSELFASFSEEKQVLVLRAIANYLYLKGVETGFLDSVPRLDEIESMIQDPASFTDPYTDDYAEYHSPEAHYLTCLFARIRGIRHPESRYIDATSILGSIRLVCGEPAAAENILYSLMGVEV